MPRYTVPYTAFRVAPSPAFPRRKQTPRPVLPVILRNGNLAWRCYAIVDSGADDCLFPYSFARQIGLDVAKGARYSFSGVGSGSQNAHFFNIRLVIPTHPRPIGYRISIGFTTALEGTAMGLLGQHGFFDRFRVGFNLQRNIFTFEMP